MKIVTQKVHETKIFRSLSWGWMDAIKKGKTFSLNILSLTARFANTQFS